MRGLFVKNGLVNNIAKFIDGVELPESWVEVPGGVAIGDIENGDGTFSRPTQPEPEPLTSEQLIKAITRAVQRHLDEQARTLGYDNIFTAITYAGEPSVPKFQQEGLALRKWRSEVWAAGYELLAAGEVLTPEAVLSRLPLFTL